MKKNGGVAEKNWINSEIEWKKTLKYILLIFILKPNGSKTKSEKDACFMDFL